MNVVTVMCANGGGVLPDVRDIVVLPDVCTEPRQLGDVLEGADGLVLALHQGRYALAEVQRAVRQAGIDPLGVQIVDLVDSEPRPGAEIATAMAGAASRAATFVGSRPEHAKPVFPRSMSRRGFLSPQPEYLAVPAVDRALCQAAAGCRICSEACPRQAYQIERGMVLYDKDACDPCGICVTACPVGAIGNPSVTPAGIEAQVRTLVSTSDAANSIAFRCERGTPIEPRPRWFEVVVPCTGMIPSHWLLAGLTLGARQVAAVPCSQSGCPLLYEEILAGRVQLARQVLAGLGFDPALVTLDPGEVAEPRSQPRSDVDRPFDSDAAARVLLALAPLDGSWPAAVHDARSPCGLVDIDGDVCSMCSMCSRICPTGALEERPTTGGIDLFFDPTRCVACAQCVAICPEGDRGAISMKPVVDFSELARGSRLVNSASIVTCIACGGPVAPDAMLDRIGAVLGNDQATTFDYLKERCQSCRGL